MKFTSRYEEDCLFLRILFDLTGGSGNSGSLASDLLSKSFTFSSTLDLLFSLLIPHTGGGGSSLKGDVGDALSTSSSSDLLGSEDDLVDAVLLKPHLSLAYVFRFEARNV